MRGRQLRRFGRDLSILATHVSTVMLTLGSRAVCDGLVWIDWVLYSSSISLFAA